jgi:hypothetical protein
MTLSEFKVKVMLPHDIANHVVGGAVIGAVTAWLWAHYEVQMFALLPWQAGLAVAALVGVAVDVADKLTGSKFTLRDAVATTAGALIPAIPLAVPTFL